jgi:hypothetical protein
MMSNCDPELRRLERALQEARDRLGWISRFMSDPAALKAAEDLCGEASAAVGAYWAMHEAPQRT